MGCRPRGGNSQPLSSLKVDWEQDCGAADEKWLRPGLERTVKLETFAGGRNREPGTTEFATVNRRRPTA